MALQHLVFAEDCESMTDLLKDCHYLGQILDSAVFLGDVRLFISGHMQWRSSPVKFMPANCGQAWSPVGPKVMGLHRWQGRKRRQTGR